MSRFVRYTIAAVLILGAVPTFAGAGETLKEVFVRNTAADPVPVQAVGVQQVGGTIEVANLPAAQQLADGSGLVEPLKNVVFPDDLILTDLVMTHQGGSAPRCEVVAYEQHGSEKKAVMFFYLTEEVVTEQLHLESGLTQNADGWGVAVNSDCFVMTLWSGYTRP